MARRARANGFPATADVALIISQGSPFTFTIFYLIRMLSHLTVFVHNVLLLLHIHSFAYTPPLFPSLGLTLLFFDNDVIVLSPTRGYSRGQLGANPHFTSVTSLMI
jgi:hypothetical protein